VIGIEVDVDLSAFDIDAIAPEVDAQMRMAMHLVMDMAVVTAKREAPVRSGHLSQSLRSRPVTGSFFDGGVEGGIQSPLPYASYVEDGTRPHLIEPRFRKALRWPAGASGFAFAQRVRHPGTDPNPFMDRAVKAVEREAEQIFADAFALAVTRAAGG
jgi:HK97 gp10 family phage protein